MYEDKNISIHAAEKTVAINGEAYVVESFDWPTDLIHLGWDPNQPRLKGHVSRQGDSYRFESFDQFERYIAAWQDAKAKADEEREAARLAEIEAAKAEQEKIDAANAAAIAEMEQQRPFYEAQRTLASTDFKIIKAMEAKLIAEGALDPDLVAKREAARQTIRDSKA